MFPPLQILLSLSTKNEWEPFASLRAKRVLMPWSILLMYLGQKGARNPPSCRASLLTDGQVITLDYSPNQAITRYPLLDKAIYIKLSSKHVMLVDGKAIYFIFTLSLNLPSDGYWPIGLPSDGYRVIA